jgi:hypothetical protein
MVVLFFPFRWSPGFSRPSLGFHASGYSLDSNVEAAKHPTPSGSEQVVGWAPF